MRDLRAKNGETHTGASGLNPAHLLQFAAAFKSVNPSTAHPHSSSDQSFVFDGRLLLLLPPVAISGHNPCTGDCCGTRCCTPATSLLRSYLRRVTFFLVLSVQRPSFPPVISPSSLTATVEVSPPASARLYSLFPDFSSCRRPVFRPLSPVPVSQPSF